MCGLTSRHTILLGLVLQLNNILSVTIYYGLKEISLSAVQSKVLYCRQIGKI